MQDERRKAFAGEIAALHSAGIRPALNLKGWGGGLPTGGGMLLFMERAA